MKIIWTAAACIFIMLGITSMVYGSDPWPAEAWRSAEILTHLDQDFDNNMSGACWNPKSRIFWICRNRWPSAFWALEENGEGSLSIATDDSGTPAKFDVGEGDLEGICQVDYDKNLVYLIVEGKDLIKEYDVTNYGKPVLKHQWDISDYVPTRWSYGSEGITFVPDQWLQSEGFTDADGEPYTSQNGMGGIMLVAHQNGGNLYAFDLNPDTDDVLFVGSYKTSQKESSGLEFDRSTGLLYIWHNTGSNYLEVTKLSSVVDDSGRRLVSVNEFTGPKSGNLEGIALTPAESADTWCLLVDDDNQDGAAVMWFKDFVSDVLPF